MRKIKFRGKRAFDDKWIYGYLIKDDKAYYITNDLCDTFYQVIPETIGQFTGLYDKNNIPIYEGDIIRATEYLNPGEVELEYQIKYIVEMCKFVSYPLLKNGKYDNNNWNLDVCYYDKEDIEVIGNIFDNKEII